MDTNTDIAPITFLKYKLYRRSITTIFKENISSHVDLSEIDQISDENINKYEKIFIVGSTIREDIPQYLLNIRKRYTGRIIGFHTFIENIDLISKYLSFFDKIFICSPKDLQRIRLNSSYNFAGYIPSPLCLIKGNDRPVRKNEIKIGIILPKVNSSILKKISKAVDQLISEGYTLLGICCEKDNLNTLQEIQRECPVFMIYSKKNKLSNIIRELSTCSCIITGTYEGFWMSICCNIPTLPILLNRSMELLSEDVGIQGVPIIKSHQGEIISLSSKLLKRKTIKCIKRNIDRQKRYVTRCRFILSSLHPISIETLSEGKLSHSEEDKVFTDKVSPSKNLSLNFPYFIHLPKEESLWKQIGTYLLPYSRNNGIFFDFDVVDSFTKLDSDLPGIIYLFEWIGIVRCNTEEEINLLFNIENKNFIGSLNTCQYLFTFSEEIRKSISIKLSDLGFNISIGTLTLPSDALNTPDALNSLDMDKVFEFVSSINSSSIFR